MAIELAQGTTIAIASAYGAAKTMSAISNASEAVATLEASHGVLQNDIVEITSGWDRLNGRIARVKTVSTNDVTLELIDTSSTSNYPAGAGTGSVRKISTWTALTQLAGITADTPQIQYIDITTLANQTRQRIPGLDESPNMSIDVFYDPSLSWVAAVLAASDANALAAVRMITPGGRKIYANAYWKMSRFPQISIGDAIKNALSLTFNSIPSSYAS